MNTLLNTALPAILFMILILGGFMVFLSPAHSDVADTAEDISGPVVLELFTSQSCSSCPPADKLLGELASRENVIALSCHVDYWNYLHWKDTQSHSFCTERQRDYSVHQGRNARIFTPEIQINGAISTVGSRSFDVQRGLEQASTNPPRNIGISVSEQGRVKIDLPKMEAGQNVQLIAYSYRAKVAQNIERGENRGRHVTYTNSVQQQFSLGTWNVSEDGKSGPMATLISAADIPRDGGIVVLAQDKTGGRILAAGHWASPVI